MDNDTPLALTVGCTFGLETPQPLSAVLQVAPSGRDVQLRSEQWDTGNAHHGYVDVFGNRCERFTIAAGASRIVYEAEVVLSSPSDRLAPGTPETPVTALPDELIAFMMPSRFCLPDELGHEAWQRFGRSRPAGSACRRSSTTSTATSIGSPARRTRGRRPPTPTAPVRASAATSPTSRSRFCRALNIPARYVFGYIPDIDIPPPAEPMDFAAWFEVYLDGAWHTFDARNNRPVAGRVVVGRGRDAVDVALITSFGPVTLTQFEVRAASTNN